MRLSKIIQSFFFKIAAISHIVEEPYRYVLSQVTQYLGFKTLFRKHHEAFTKTPNIASPPAVPVISSDMAFRKHGLSPLKLPDALSFLDNRINEFYYSAAGIEFKSRTLIDKNVE